MKTKASHILAFATALLTLSLTAAEPSHRTPPTLEDHVADSHLIVVGEIQRIDPPADLNPKTGRAYDTALIKVERVLRDTTATADSKPPISKPKPGSLVPLSQPAAQIPRMSTDVLYQKGDRGVWLLRLHDGKFYGSHPSVFRPLTDEKQIIAAIKQVAKPATPAK